MSIKQSLSNHKRPDVVGQNDQANIATVALLGEASLRRSPEIEVERTRALADLQKRNRFRLHGDDLNSQYDLSLELISDALVMSILPLPLGHTKSQSADARHINVSMRGFKKIIKDYFMICESFYSFARSGQTHKIEAIDMARRGIHNEGAEMLQRRLSKHVVCDFDTARQLFTLICILHIRIPI